MNQRARHDTVNFGFTYRVVHQRSQGESVIAGKYNTQFAGCIAQRYLIGQARDQFVFVEHKLCRYREIVLGILHHASITHRNGRRIATYPTCESETLVGSGAEGNFSTIVRGSFSGHFVNKASIARA